MSRRFMLDTNMASYLMRGTSEFARRRLTQELASTLTISAVTEGELRFGVVRRGSPARMAAELAWFLGHVSIMPWDSAAAATYASLRTSQEKIGKPLGALDMLIAAHAIAVGATLVSADTAFRSAAGLSLEDWTRP